MQPDYLHSRNLCGWKVGKLEEGELNHIALKKACSCNTSRKVENHIIYIGCIGAREWSELISLTFVLN